VKHILVLLTACVLLSSPVRAAEGWTQALPPLIRESFVSEENFVLSALEALLQMGEDVLHGALSQSISGALKLVLIALLCGMAQSLSEGVGKGFPVVTLTGALAITSVAAGDLRSLIGLGAAAMEELGVFARMLLPTMASAIAGGGFPVTAGIWQVATLFVCDFLLRTVRELLLPAAYCYIGLCTAGAILPASRLDFLAKGLKKAITWFLCAMMSIFTVFLTMSSVLSGSADKTAVKMTKSAITGAVPIIGGILSETTEAVLAAASALRSVVGAAGIFSVLAICLAPLLQLGIQYLSYQLAAFLASFSGVKPLDALIERLGECFALIFAMTAACALVLLVAILVSVTMVVM